MKVDPITEVKHIRAIKKLLAENPRDKLLFIMGINSGMRVQDLLQFRIKDVCHKAVGDRITLVEKKTGKENVLIINQEIGTLLNEPLKPRQECSAAGGFANCCR